MHHPPPTPSSISHKPQNVHKSYTARVLLPGGVREATHIQQDAQHKPDPHSGKAKRLNASHRQPLCRGGAGGTGCRPPSRGVWGATRPQARSQAQIPIFKILWLTGYLTGKTLPPHPPTPSPTGGEGEKEYCGSAQSPSPALGEGFGVRAIAFPSSNNPGWQRFPHTLLARGAEDFRVVKQSKHLLLKAFLLCQLGIFPTLPAVAQIPTPPGEVPVDSIQQRSISGTPPCCAESISINDYTLSIGDTITLSLATAPEYNGSYRIQSNGTANLPVLGQLSLTGLTLQEAESAIETAYVREELLVAPVATLTLAEISPLQVVITGEVNQPGTYTLPITAGQLPTVAIAIDQAGGITQHTDLRNIQIQRRQPQAQNLTVNLWALLTEGDHSQNLTLRNGDTLIIPEAPPLDLATAETLATSTFSPDSIQINLIGEVAQPGVMQVPPGTSLNQALFLAGGFTSRSRRSSIKLLRLSPNGTVAQRRIEIDLEDSINDETNPLLHDRDVILIGRNTAAEVSDRLSTISAPLNGALSLINLFLPFLLP